MILSQSQAPAQMAMAMRRRYGRRRPGIHDHGSTLKTVYIDPCKARLLRQAGVPIPDPFTPDFAPKKSYTLTPSMHGAIRDNASTIGVL